MPAINEWTILIHNLGDYSAGDKLKAYGTVHWNSPNSGATNETGFTALPGGGRSEDGAFAVVGDQGIFWSSTSGTKTIYETRYVTTNRTGKGGKYIQVPIQFQCQKAIYTTNFSSSAAGLDGGLKSGFSVRWVCDNITSGINNLNTEAMVFYPNPVNDRLYLKNSNYVSTLIMIYDLQGKKVLDGKVDSESIDISNLSKGIYIVKVLFPEKIMIAKFIKE